MQFSYSKDVVLESPSYAKIIASNDVLDINGGAKLELYSISNCNEYQNDGSFKLSARKRDGNYIELVGDGDGLLTWNGLPIATSDISFDNKYLRLDGSNRMNGHILADDSRPNMGFGYNYRSYVGGSILFRSASDTSGTPGSFQIIAAKSENERCELLGKTDGTLTWDGKNLVTEDKLSELVSGRGVGEQWITMDGTIPEGGIPFNGQLVLKADYPELWDWVVKNKRKKTETEWQTSCSNNNSNVPYYSDYSTTHFRMPIFRGYLKANETGGDYIKQGLPDHYHKITQQVAIPGVMYSDVDDRFGETVGPANITTSYASETNSIYGRSSNVTPETNTILVGVYAWSIVVGGSTLNARSDIIGNINASAALNFIDIGYKYADAKGALLSLRGTNYTDNPCGFELIAKNASTEKILAGRTNGQLTWAGKTVLTENYVKSSVIETWQNETSWYRKYSDGWIEQGGKGTTGSAINFYRPFTKIPYILISGMNDGRNNQWAIGHNNLSLTGFTPTRYSGGAFEIFWRACGY